MSQVNNNAESLSRELRKLKNVKSVDFRGLLSGNTESFMNLYRYLFCEHNIVFSRHIVEKGFDLSGLSDYKFMEAIYKIMRDLFNLKPPINQNQFLSQGFTQRKLEMSTMLTAHVRKVIYELNSKTNKKTVQTQSLMKTSLKRPSSAPKQTKVTELGDDEDDDDNYIKPRSYSMNNNRSKKSKPVSKFSERNSKVSGESKKNSGFKTVEDEDDNNGLSSDSEPSNPANSYNFSNKINSNPSEIHKYDNNDLLTRGIDKYSVAPMYRDPVELSSVSAYESNALDHESYLRPQKYQPYVRSDIHDQKIYDVKQYTPRSIDENLTMKKDTDIPGLDKIMQQFDTVLARITLLESRMQRIESKFDNNTNSLFEHQKQPYIQSPYCSGQNNQNNQQFSVPHNYHETNPYGSYKERNAYPMRDSRTVISDFESNIQGHTIKPDSSRPYSSYGVHNQGSVRNNNDTLYQPYIVNTSGSTKSDVLYTNNGPSSYRSQLSTDLSNTMVPKYVSSTTNYSDKRSLDMNNSSKENNSYRITNTSTKYTQPSQQKIHNGIPPIHPTMKKSDDSGFDENNRHGKMNFEKNDTYIQSQTDRIASLLSDTQKMLRISDEEL